jgi:oligosaccharide repeat unit polymerase
MKSAFFIFVGYAFIGYLYYPSQYTLFSLFLIIFYSLPLLIAGILVKDKIYSRFKIVKPIIYWLVIILGFVNLSIIVNNTNSSFLDIFSFEGIIHIAQESTGIRYGSNSTTHSGNPILLALTLWLIFRVGTTTRLIKGYIQILPFIPLIMYTLLTTEKYPCILGILFYVSGILISNEKKEYRKILKSKIKYGIILSLLMGLSIFIRGYTGTINDIFDVGLNYLLAQYNSLGYWYLEMKSSDFSFGKFTFIGPLSYLGLVERENGVFTETLVLNGLESNLFTAFRYVIQDFGVFSPFVFSFSVSFIYLITRVKKFVKLSSIIILSVLYIALSSFSAPPFVHNSVFLCYFLMMFSNYKAKQFIY